MYRAPDIARAVTVNNRVAHHPPAHPSLEHLHLGGLRRRRRAPRSLNLSPEDLQPRDHRPLEYGEDDGREQGGHPAYR